MSIRKIDIAEGDEDQNNVQDDQGDIEGLPSTIGSSTPNDNGQEPNTQTKLHNKLPKKSRDSGSFQCLGLGVMTTPKPSVSEEAL